MGKDYEIQKTSDDEAHVAYRCPACGHPIESLLSDAGSTDNCSACGKAVTVPGEAEWQLLHPAEDNRDAKGDFTVAWIVNTAVEAQLATVALAEAGIKYLSEDFQRNPYDGVFATQFGWGRILVRELDVERAKEIIQEALQPCPLEDEEDPSDDDTKVESD